MNKDRKNIIIVAVSIIVSGIVLYFAAVPGSISSIIDELNRPMVTEDSLNKTTKYKHTAPVEEDGTTHNITSDGTKYDVLSEEQKEVVEIIESAFNLMEPSSRDMIQIFYQGAIDDDTFSFNINRYFREFYETKGYGVIRMEDTCDENGMFNVLISKY